MAWDRETADRENPIENLNETYITLHGLRTILKDTGLCHETQEELLQSERPLVKERYPEYEYLLSTHDVMKVYNDNFVYGEGIGLAHVSLIIDDNPKADYASFIAQYALERYIPFIAALIMIEDLKKVEGVLHRISSISGGYDIRCIRTPWNPNCGEILPPLNLGKAAASKAETVPGLKDNYYVQTYISAGCCSERAAEMLGISRPTFIKRLNSIGMPVEVKGNPDAVREWLNQKEEQLKSEISELYLSGYDVEPPIVKSEYCYIIPDAITLAEAYFANGKDEDKAAKSLNMIPSVYRSVTQPLLLKKSGKYTVTAIAGAVCAFKGDKKKAAEALGMCMADFEKRLYTTQRFFKKNGCNPPTGSVFAEYYV